MNEDDPDIPLLQPCCRIQKNHLISSIIGNRLDGRKNRDKPIINYRDIINNSCFISNSEPKNINEAIIDEYWIVIMQKEVSEFERNDVKETLSAQN